MKTRGSPSSATASSILDKRQYDREIPFHQLPEGDVPLSQEAERVQWDEWVKSRGSPNDPREVEEPLLFATPSREVEEPLFFETPSPGAYEGSRRDTVINMEPTWSLVH